MISEYITNLQNGLSPKERLYQIVQHGMCIGCGICQSISGPNNVQMQVADNGFERPVVSGYLTHETMDKIIQVCPGTQARGLPENLIDSESNNDEVWGIWREIYLSWSANPEIRHMASTGGLLTALALYLLDSNQVDFVLHACEPEANPTFGKRFISRNKEDVLLASGSRYGPTATLQDVIEVLQQAEVNGEKFAFIGTPCDVTALRNYARLDNRVDHLCKYMLTMVCGGFMVPDGMKTFLKAMDIEFDEVKSLRYRGYGCPGPTTIETTDGRVISKNYLDLWGEDDSAWQLPPRCKICPDGIGDAADIAASDTWIGGAPTWEAQKNDLGTNAAVVRSQKGVILMENAIRNGYLVKGEMLQPEDMNRFQPHQEAKKRAVWARYKGMRLANNLVPETSGLRLEALWKKNEDNFNAKETEGAKNRVMLGKFAEAVPESVPESSV